MSRLIRVLSIDGGGIRGVIPAQFLIALERQLRAYTGRPDASISDYFDFFAGTSTGGIITCLLLTPDPDDPTRPKYDAEAVRGTYEDASHLVFSSSLWRRLRSAGGFLHKKFDSFGLEQAFANYFGETRLKDLLRPCLVTAYDIMRGKPHFFTQHDARNRIGHDFYVRDVARATSAAPVFFEVALARNDLGEEYPLIDGGVFANNPALCAYAEVRTLWEKAAASDMLVLSLGTGQVPISLRYEAARSFGVVRWLGPLPDIMVSSASATVDYQLGKIFGATGGESQYLRLNTVLGIEPLPRRDIDDAAPENIAALREAGERLFEQNETRLEPFIERLIQPEQGGRLSLVPSALSNWWRSRARMN